ncbi:MAG: ABC transporter substrate-binding protein [Bauldia sp.]|nr:ABC transporter substrate-binding protein [Bauldia sp.]MCW5716415.1 ABC transporter substrate-binding protein [Bauldia sp.]
MRKTVVLLAATAFATLISGGAFAQTLVYCSEGSPEGFDPGPFTAGTTFDATRPVYDRLVVFEPGTTDVGEGLGLAESWEISEDGLTYTFHLKPGVEFHSTNYFTPTRTLNADDVIFSFMRQSDQSSPWYQYTSGISWEYYNAMSMPDLVESIEKVDDLTVAFHLTRPEAPFLANMGMDFASIVSKEYADQLEAAGNMVQFNQLPIGTGPFQFVAYQPDATIRYGRFDGYWGTPAGVQSLIFSITVDASVRAQKLIAGECDIMAYPNPADIAMLEANANILLETQEGLNVGFLAYNTQQAPFDNAQVRTALNLAINKEAILEAVYQGFGQAAVNPIPPTMWSYNTAITDWEYNPTEARAMLEAAGVTNLTMNVWAMPVSRPYNPNARRMAELIQADFAAIGVTVNIVSYEWGEYLARSQEVDRDGAVLLGWNGDNGDPDNFLAVLLGCDAVGGANRAQWCNEEFDALVQQAKVVSNQDERAALYMQAQEIFHAEAPWAPIAHSLAVMPVRSNVQGYVMNPFAIHEFATVTVE